MPRFVILRHEFPAESSRSSHWDLMLENEGVLLTWELTQLLQPGESFLAKRLADHRLAYLEYEGPISGDRGEVHRVASGELTWMLDDLPFHAVALLSGEAETWLLDLTAEEDEHWLIRRLVRGE